ncbi:substrate-binding domain-containing protein [Mesorhizobium sp. B2-3-5]|nr:substrate-binding domain-containing protein [Mesorhizobium sp. B2-3-5]
MIGRLVSILAKGAVAALIGLGGTALMAQGAEAKGPPYKIFLSMSYVGNDWQTESGNIVAAMAKFYSDKVEFATQVAGTNAQAQIQQINAMVQSGADAIVMFPISPTALNATIKAACAKGVKIFTYEAAVTEPCAYNLTIDEAEMGTKTAEWLVKEIGGKGNIVMVTGVPGTSTDTIRNQSAMKVFAQHPDVKIIATVNGMWSQATARSELSKVIATHPWSEINGVWAQVGCMAAAMMQDEAGIADKDKVPCTDEAFNGVRIQMLPASTEVEGASGAYRAMGLRAMSYGAPLYQGGLQLKRALELLENGKEPPHDAFVPLPIVTPENVKLCKGGSWQELADGCNTFTPKQVSNPAWFTEIYSAETPEIGFNAAVDGTPEQKK